MAAGIAADAWKTTGSSDQGQQAKLESEAFRRKVDECLNEIGRRLGACLEEARASGEIAPDTDVKRMASLLVDCWEGAALRSRLRGSPAPLGAMLDFYFDSLARR